MSFTFDEIKKEITDSEALMLTCYGEARGETPNGQIAVMQVILNRAKSRNQSLKQVCFAPLQFSCWNEKDPNRPILIELANKMLIDRDPQFDHAMEQILFLSAGVIDKVIMDLVHGAQHYMTSALYNSDKKPSWAEHPKSSTIIGSHIFLVI